MRFSLILATVDRTLEVKRFLRSLDSQTHRDFELILVDQNEDNRLSPLVKHYSERFPINHLRSERGLSRARNVGLRHLKGEIVAFPDDDCVYRSDLLALVAHYLASHPAYSGLTGKAVSIDDGTPVWRFADACAVIDKKNIFCCAASFSIFLRRSVVDTVGQFDESLGVGAGTGWGSGEETDYLCRCIDAGATIFYDPEIEVLHPKPTVTYDANTVSRGYLYGRGMGRVMSMQKFPFIFVTKTFIRPLGGAVLAFLACRFMKARYHWAVCRGRFCGWYGDKENIF